MPTLTAINQQTKLLTDDFRMAVRKRNVKNEKPKKGAAKEEPKVGTPWVKIVSIVLLLLCCIIFINVQFSIVHHQMIQV